MVTTNATWRRNGAGQANGQELEFAEQCVARG